MYDLIFLISDISSGTYSAVLHGSQWERLQASGAMALQHSQGPSASVLTGTGDEDICFDWPKRKMVAFMGIEIIPAG